MVRNLLSNTYTIRKIVLISTATCMLASADAGAQSITLYRSGSIVPPGFSTVSDAVAAALPDDSLVLSAHTFKEHDLHIDKNLFITGSIDASGISTIDAEYKGRVLLVSSGDVGIHNLTIQNGKVTNSAGGGICNYGNGNLTLTGVSSVNSCSCMGTYANGGGIFSAGPLFLYENTTVQNNVSEETGGGVYAYTTFVIGGNTKIVNNKTYGSGGGIFSVSNGAATITDNALISNNSADLTGGGLFGVGTLSKKANISNNKADFGAGVAAFNDLLIIRDAVNISNNTATTAGAGIWLNNCTLNANGDFKISNNKIPAATGSTNYGGAIYNVNGSLFINGGTITGNQSPVSAIYSTASTAARQINFHSVHMYNPNADGTRNTEIYISPSLPTSNIVFTSDSCWWGSNDTSKLVINRPGTSSGTINTYAVLNWKLNDGDPIDPLATGFSLEAEFSLSSGDNIDTARLRSIQGHFIANKGSFSPNTANINRQNKVYSDFTGPDATDTVMVTAYIDADTFKSGKIVLTGLSVLDKNLARNIHLYPNPTSGTLFVNGAEEGTWIGLYTLDGKLILNKVSVTDLEQIDLNGINTGNYILEIRDKEGKRHSTPISKL